MERLHQPDRSTISGYLSFSPTPLFLSEASISSLRVTLTHFALSSYERTLRLPTSFPISGLARFGVKSRHCRSSWRAFSLLTHSCFLLLPLGRLSLLALSYPFGTCLPLLWSPLFPLHAPTLMPSYLAKVRLSLAMTLSHFTIWCFGRAAPLLFLLIKAALTFLPTALSVALRPLFPFEQVQYAQVFPLKPAPFCKLFAGLGSTNKSATSLLLPSALALSSPPFFILPESLG